MNLNRLRIFHTAAELSSFTRAAAELHLTQPGVSKHIAALEEQYGTKLFDRVGKRIVLTQAGEILKEATTAMLAQLDEARKRIEGLQGLSGGELRIGASITIAAYLLPPLLTRFRQRAPLVALTIETAHSGQIVEQVLAHALEFGLVGHHPADPRLGVLTFLKDPMVLVVSPRHRWARRKRPVRLDELAQETFLLSKPGSGTWRFMSQYLEASGSRLQNRVELGTTEAVKRGVTAELGVSILSRHVLQVELAGGMLTEVPLAGGAPERELFLVHHKDRQLSRAAQAFLEFLPGAGR